MAFTAKQARNQAIAISEAYTKQSLDGAGALKGAPCEVKSIVKENGRNTVTFLWKDKNDVSHESQMIVLDGTPIYVWTSGDSYTYGDLVIYASAFYRCITPNSDVQFDDTKWNEIGSPDGNYDIVENSDLLPAIFTAADRKLYYSIEDGFFWLWNGEEWEAQVDNEPVEGGTGYVSSGALFNVKRGLDDKLSANITVTRIEEIADGVFSNALQLTVGQYYKMGTAPNYQDGTEWVPIYWMCAEKLADGIYAMQCSCMDNGFFGPNYMEPHDYSYTDIRPLAYFDNDPSNTSTFYAAFSSIEANGGRNSSGVYVAGAAKNGLYLPSLRELGVTAEQVDAAEEGTVVGTGYYWQSLVDSMNADPMDGTEGSWIAYVGENKNLANVPYNVFNDFIVGQSWDSTGGLYPVFNIDTSKIEVSQDNTITVKGD